VKRADAALADGDKIIELRQARGWNRKELQEKCGLPLSTLARAEKGKRLRTTNLAEIAEALGTDVEEIIRPGFSVSPQTVDALVPRILSFESFIDDRIRDFEGRKDLFEKIEEFLADPKLPSGYFVIRGDPGIGKSAALASLIRRKKLPVHHLNIAAQGITTAHQCLGNICARLIRQYSLSDTTAPPDFAKSGAFLSQLLDAVADRMSPGEKLVIAIDALDEAEPSDSGTSRPSNALFLPVAVPDNIFFVVTMRDRPGLFLQATTIREYPIEADSPSNRRDAESYIARFLERADNSRRFEHRDFTADEFVAHVFERSEGNFMYLRHVLPTIGLGWFDDESAQDLPQGLREYYKCHWEQMQRKAGSELSRLYEPVVCSLAAAFEPVPIIRLMEATDLTASEVRKVLHDWHEFLHRVAGEGSTVHYCLYHSEFRAFLEAEVDPGLERSHARLANATLKKLGSWEDPPAG
jgi:transcriptional regulator with XRE-family HTH domain